MEQDKAWPSYGCLMRPEQAKLRTHQSGRTDLGSPSFH